MGERDGSPGRRLNLAHGPAWIPIRTRGLRLRRRRLPEPEMVADIAAHAVGVLSAQRLTAAVAVGSGPAIAGFLNMATRQDDWIVGRYLSVSSLIGLCKN